MRRSNSEYLSQPQLTPAQLAELTKVLKMFLVKLELKQRELGMRFETERPDDYEFYKKNGGVRVWSQIKTRCRRLVCDKDDVKANNLEQFKEIISELLENKAPSIKAIDKTLSGLSHIQTFKMGSLAKHRNPFSLWSAKRRQNKRTHSLVLIQKYNYKISCIRSDVAPVIDGSRANSI